MKYQNKTFAAFPLRDSDYKENTSVYILVPNNEMERRRFILGAIKIEPESLLVSILADIVNGNMAAAKEKIKELGGDIDE